MMYRYLYLNIAAGTWAALPGSVPPTELARLRQAGYTIVPCATHAVYEEERERTRQWAAAAQARAARVRR